MPSNLRPELAARLSPDTVSMIERVEEWLAGNAPGTLVVVTEDLFDTIVCTSLDDATVDARMAVRPCDHTGALVWSRNPDFQPVPCQRNTDTHRHIGYTVTDRPGED